MVVPAAPNSPPGLLVAPNNPVPVEAAPKVLPKAGAAVLAAVAPKPLPVPKVGATVAVGWPKLVPKAGAGADAGVPKAEPNEGWGVAPKVEVVPKLPKPDEVVAVVVVAAPKVSGVPKPVAGR